MGSLSPGDRRPLLVPRLSFRQSLCAVTRFVRTCRMVRAHHLALVGPSGRYVSPICSSLLPASRRRRNNSPTPRSETAFLRHLSEHRGQRSLLGSALRRVHSTGLRPMVSRSADRLWGVSRLGPCPPAVRLRCLCRGLRVRG